MTRIRLRPSVLAVLGFFAVAKTFFSLPGESAEQWVCQLVSDSPRGGGILEFTQQGREIRGKTRLENAEYTIQGGWIRDRISFRRILTRTESEMYRGVVVQGPQELRIKGEVSIPGGQGAWSCVCQRVIAAAPSPAAPAVSPTFPAGAQFPFDFVARAAQARWTNAWVRLPFPGQSSDSKGFARVLPTAVLDDGRTYQGVLQTHPHQQPRGIIVGHYPNITIPAAGAEFRSTIGFLRGAQASDGVYFEVGADFPGYTGIPVRVQYHLKPGLVISDFQRDLSRFAGRTGTIRLVVDAGERSAVSDQAVWVKPSLVFLNGEYRFATFVGGAVGSGRVGNQLLNPWGGKAGNLYGNVILYLLFANLEGSHSLSIDSSFEGQPMGSTNLGSVAPGRTEVWHTLPRTRKGAWKERVIFNGSYWGDIRYTISPEPGE